MSAFTSSPFSLTLGTLITIQVKAKNEYGWASSYSPSNIAGVVVETPPQTPSSAPVKGSSTSASQIEISFSSVSDATSYNLYWDEGLGGSLSLLVQLQGTSYIQTIAVQPGWNYTYAYSAMNIFGESGQSPSVSIQAVSVPSKMLAPLLTVIGTEVKISWLVPDNGGSAIIGY